MKNQPFSQGDRDLTLDGFLQTALDDFETINRDSDVVRLLPGRHAGRLPNEYACLFRDVEHLVIDVAGTVHVSTEPVQLAIMFPDDYLRSADKTLLYRVVRIESPLYHPNVLGSTLCLGDAFRPGTRLRALVWQLYWVVGCKNFASESPLDHAASRYYWANLDQVRALRARPLWRDRIARHVRVERHADSAANEQEGEQ